MISVIGAILLALQSEFFLSAEITVPRILTVPSVRIESDTTVFALNNTQMQNRLMDWKSYINAQFETVLLSEGSHGNLLHFEVNIQIMAGTIMKNIKTA